MTDLATVLARMMELADLPPSGGGWDNMAARLAATPEGKALAALVEAALTLRDAYVARWEVATGQRDPQTFDPRTESDAMLELVRRVDAYREATK